MNLPAGAPHAARADAASVPAGEEWLGPRERVVLAGLALPKRRDDWRLGRWVAKRALHETLADRGVAAEPREIEILAADDGAPEAHLRGDPLPLAISLSHSSGVGFCVVAVDGARPGCDVERIERRDPRFASDYFAPEEARLVAACPADARDLATTLLWSAKESALKAMREGLRRDTRGVRVRLGEGLDRSGWRPLRVECAATSRRFVGHWNRIGSEVFTVVLGR